MNKYEMLDQIETLTSEWEIRETDYLQDSSFYGQQDKAQEVRLCIDELKDLINELRDE